MCVCVCVCVCVCRNSVPEEFGDPPQGALDCSFSSVVEDETKFKNQVALITHLILSPCLWAAQFVQALSDLVHGTSPQKMYISQPLRILWAPTVY